MSWNNKEEILCKNKLCIMLVFLYTTC